ncbi:SWIM zinc finger family protein [Streptomyces sp. NPDC002787]
MRAARERDRYGAEAGDQRASRSARGAGAGAAPGGTKPDAESGERTGACAARPGDVARNALRRAAESRGAGFGEPAGERGAAESAEERGAAESVTRSSAEGRATERTPADAGASPLGEGPASGAGPSGAAQSGARPGDIAREALRAARDAAERARAEAEGARAETAGKGSRASRRAASGERVPRGATAGDRASGVQGRDERGSGTRLPDADADADDRGSAKRVRDVHTLLADAFKLPSEVEESDEAFAEGTDTERGGGGVAATGTGAPHDRATHGYAGHGYATREPSLGMGGPFGRRPGSGSSAVPDPEAGPAPESAPSPAPDPAPTRVPRTMAAPSRDGELRRTFRPFPPRASAGEAFAESWWGNAWVAALEEGALDAARLARGRAYADKGHVDAITVTPGLVLAYVHGSRPRPYRVQVRLRTLDDDEWDRFLDAAAEQPGHIAALLHKEMPQALAGPEPGVAVDPALAPRPGTGAARGGGRGVRLLPGPGELEPRCSCPDFGHPCKHAAALCYQTARLLDEDPFVLLLLRGRGERELLDALSRRNAARAARAAQEQEPAPLPGVRARDALARRDLPPLPGPLPPPPHPEQPPVYPGAPGGPDPLALDQLATDAAARAHALLTTGRDPVAELTLWQDAVRLAAARPGSGLTATTRVLYSSLAAATGRTPADLARAVAAWRQGGLEGLAVLEEPWDPPAGRFDRARPLLLAADLPAFRPWHNHLTHPRGHIQLRLGRDGLWYAYESEPGHDDWWPRGTPDLDPVGALTGLGATDD